MYAHTFTYVYVDIESEIRVGIIENSSLLTYSNIFEKCLGSRTLKRLIWEQLQTSENYKNKSSTRGTHKFTYFHILPHLSYHFSISMYLYVYIHTFLSTYLKQNIFG